MLNDVVKDVVADFEEEKRPSTEEVERIQKGIDSLSQDTFAVVQGLPLGVQYALIRYCFRNSDRICPNMDFCIKVILDRGEYKEYPYRWKPDWMRQCDKDWEFIYDSFEFAPETEKEKREERYKAIQDAKVNLETTEYTYESRATVEFWYKRLVREVNKWMK